MLSTGRMPLANPGDQPVRDEPKFSPEQTAAIVAYVETIAPGGEPIPTSTRPRATSRAERVFLNTCAGCHGAGATGDSVGGGQIAPTIDPANRHADRRGDPDRARADAQVRGRETIDPGGPGFGGGLSAAGSATTATKAGLQLGRVGAVAEGLVAVVVGLGLLMLVLRLTGAKT